MIREFTKAMKNACLVWNNDKNSTFEEGVRAVTDAFHLGGCDFDEVRILLQADEKKFTSAVVELRSTYDNVVIITGAGHLLYAKTILSSIIGEENFQGTASGAGIFTTKEKTAFLVAATTTESGVVYVKTTCIPFLERKYDMRLDRTVIRCVGANEQHVKNLLIKAKAIDSGKMRYFHTRKFDEDVIEIMYDENVSKRVADDVLRVFADGLDESVYALDDTPLAEQLVHLLKLRLRKISVAESFTGGGIAKRIVSVSGASEVYYEGLNTYNEASKVQRLGVTEFTLKSFSAVSDQTAYEMAAGLIATGNCDISIATTGLAGPKTDRSMLPVGLCYVAIGTKESVYVYRYKFDGTREEITEKAINYALFLAYKQLKNM